MYTVSLPFVVWLLSGSCHRHLAGERGLVGITFLSEAFGNLFLKWQVFFSKKSEAETVTYGFGPDHFIFSQKLFSFLIFLMRTRLLSYFNYFKSKVICYTVTAKTFSNRFIAWHIYVHTHICMFFIEYSFTK